MLDIRATTSGGELSSLTDPTIFMHGYAAASNVGGIDFTSPESGLAHLTGATTGLVLDFFGFPAILGEDNGDSNRDRDQGVFIVDSNTISFSSGTAIDISAGSTDPGNKVPEEGDRPKPGATQNLPTLSTEGLVHGAVVQNNLLISNGNGIRLEGDDDLGGPATYSRILNNTIFNSGIGIDIAGTAAPTLLNNVLVENTTGLRGTGSGPRVVRGTVFADNGANVDGITLGTEAIVNPTGPLFVNPSDADFGLAAGNPNFYPAAGSVLIDSSIESQLDRNSIVAVKDELNIPQSPIVVTERDLAGQLRGDGSSSGGQGQNINIDRGALDRSDVLGPAATITVPADNDLDLVDIDRNDTFLQLSSGIFNFFEVLIGDGSGIGPDQSSITPEQVAVFENGRRLVDGSEFTFAYNVSNRTLRLTPTAGIWRPDAVYEIVLLNELFTDEFGGTILPIADLAGNSLQPNRADGQTRFTIVMPEVELDFADSFNPSLGTDRYPTFLQNDGARHAIVDSGSLKLGQLIDSEVDFAGTNDSDDAVSTIAVDGDVTDAGSGPFIITGNGSTNVEVQLSALPDSGTTFSIAAGDGSVVFELVEGDGNVAVGRIPVRFPAGATVPEITELLATAMATELPERNVQAAASLSAAGDAIVLAGQDDEDGFVIGEFDFGGTLLDFAFFDPTTGEFDSFLNPLDALGSEVLLSVTGIGFVDAFVDFNGDGDFEDAGERVLDSVAVTNGINAVTLVTPFDAAVAENASGIGNTRARFRISTTGGLEPGGLAVNGEVEDYSVTVAKSLVLVDGADIFTVNEDEILSGVVSGEAGSLVGSETFTYEVLTDPVNGTLTSFNSDDGTFTYQPNPEFFGSDSFEYRIVSDSGADFLGTDRTALITVVAVNDLPTVGPVVVDDVNEDDITQPISITGISAGPLEDQPLSITVFSSNTTLVTNESIVLNYVSPDATGSFDYTLEPNQFGETTFTITVTDGGLDGDLLTLLDNATVTESFVLTVNSTPDIPVPADDAFGGDEDNVVLISSDQLTTNDVAIDLDSPNDLTVTLIDAATVTTPTQTITSSFGATVTLDTVTGQIFYDPRDAADLQALAPGDFVEDSFSYFVNDGTLSDPLPTATVSLTIFGVNDAPTAADDLTNAPALPVDPSLLDPILIRPLSNDGDIDGTIDLNSFTVIQDPTLGTVTTQLVDDGNGNQVLEVAYAPSSEFEGADTFTYRVSDSFGLQSNEATITIQPSRSPIAGPDIGGGVAADGITINVTDNDVPVVGSLDLTSLIISTQAVNGTAIANDDGTVSYVPNDGFIGSDSFQYTVADDEGNVSAPVTVVVNSVASGLQNPIEFMDVDANGQITAFDALLIINRIERAGGTTVPVQNAERGPNFFDVNGDNNVSSFDALLVINRVGQAAPTSEGELLQSTTLVAPATSLPPVVLPGILPPSVRSSATATSVSGGEVDVTDGQSGDSTVSVDPSDKLVSGAQAIAASDGVDDSLVDLLAAEAGSGTDAEAAEAVSAEFATDLAFKTLR